MIGLVDLFVGTRMHSNIFALSQHVPCVAIAYEVKTNGIMRMFDLSDHVINIEDITALRLVTAVERALAARDQLKMQISSRMCQVEREALFGGSLVAELLRSQC